jgi:methyltransferase (TIGR00027 family)
MKAQPAILEDSAAIWLLDLPLRVILRIAMLRKLFWERLLARVRPISAFIEVRSRYVEDCLERAIGDGCRQYVILGSGLDSWALRHDLPEVRVFELDQPAAQDWKAARIKDRLGALPANLELIPIDFERQSIREFLDGSNYDRNSPAFVSWLGTLYYLSQQPLKPAWRLWLRSARRAASLYATILFRNQACRPRTCSCLRRWIPAGRGVGNH